MQKDPVHAMAENVRRLMTDRGDSQKSLADRAGLSQRAIGDLLTYGRGHFKSPTIRTADAIAGALDTTLWALLIPSMDVDLLKSRALLGIIESYRSASTEGRDTILRIAQAESRYARAGLLTGSDR